MHRFNVRWKCRALILRAFKFQPCTFNTEFAFSWQEGHPYRSTCNRGARTGEIDVVEIDVGKIDSASGRTWV